MIESTALNLATPGVYTQELNAFPNSVVAVPTAVPAFVGYTARAD
jgi:phage tail sheath protein FI